MFLKDYRENPRSLFMIFAVLVTVFWCGANLTTTNAQTPTPTPKRVPMDFTGDGRSDWATIVIPAATGLPLRWKVTGNPAAPGPNNAFQRAFDYGFSGDFIVPADYILDRKTDVTVWRPGTPGIFYVAEFPTGPGGITLNQAVRWGTADDRLVFQGGDYDGGGKADYTVVRVNSTTGNLTWFIKSSTTGIERAVPFGTRAGTVISVIFPGADFNNDGRDELVLATVNSASLVTYFIGDSITGAGVLTRQFGDYDADNTLAPGDYTGDGRADFVAVRQTTSPATWYINDSATNTTTARQFGISDPTFSGNSDTPIRGDYDGDGKFDIAVFRRSTANFFYLRSSTNNATVDGQKAGDPGDTPLAGFQVNF